MEQCRDLLAVLSSRFPDSDAACLLNAALLLREKRSAKADDVLAAFLSSRRGATATERVLLMRAQLAAAAGDAARTLAALEELAEPLRFSPRIVATCVALHVSQNALGNGEKLLDAALAYWDAGAAPSRAACLARASADFKHSSGQHAASVALYERLLQDAPTEEARAGALAGLVLACSHTDLAAAERYALRVAPGGVGDDLDAEELEMSVALVSQPGEPADVDGASRKRDAPPGAQPGVPERPRKRRARKTRYPKGFDPAAPGNPPPDPERWLPRRERSSFKGKKSKKAAQLRGAQGAAPAAAAVAAAVPAVPVAVPEGKTKKGKGKR